MTKKNPIVRMFVMHLAVIAVLVAMLFAYTKYAGGKADQNMTTIYVVRHAEKVTGADAGRDPALTAAGENRAKVLATILKDKNITHVHSSNYIRTRDTAAPLAASAGTEILIYDPRDLPALAAQITAEGGVHLVVGHSNTIQETVTALGGVIDVSPVEEAGEYDRLYRVQITLSENGDREHKVALSRYGVRYKADE